MRTPSPTVMFSPRLNRPVVAPNCRTALLELGEVVLGRALVAELDQPDPALLEHQGVVVPLVPALQVQPAGLLVHDRHAQRVRVVVAGFLEVRYPDVHVPQSHDAHVILSFLSFLVAGLGADRPGGGGAEFG